MLDVSAAPISPLTTSCQNQILKNLTNYEYGTHHLVHS